AAGEELGQNRRVFGNDTEGEGLDFRNRTPVIFLGLKHQLVTPRPGTELVGTGAYWLRADAIQPVRMGVVRGVDGMLEGQPLQEDGIGRQGGDTHRVIVDDLD